MKNISENGLEFIKDLSWRDVFEIWRENEEGRENWKRVWKEKGFDSWEEWRMRYAESFKLPDRTWRLFRVREPLATVPKFCGGPFRAWVERFYGDSSDPTFAELAKHEEIINHDGVRDIMNRFPEKTTVSAIETRSGITVVEGMHRCSAISLAASENHPVQTDFMLALGSEIPGDLPVVGKFRKEDPS